MTSSATPRLNRVSITRALAIGIAVLAVVWSMAQVLDAGRRPFNANPAPDSIEYADGAWQLGHLHAYVTFYDERTASFGTVARPPRYPFGTSLLLAPFSLLDDHFPDSAQVGSRAIAVGYVIAVAVAAWILGGPLAAAAAAFFVGISPFASVSGTLILSDAPSALLAVMILIVLATGRGRRAAMLAGAIAGLLVCVRLLGVVAIPAVVLAVGRRRAAAALLGAVPFVAALGIFQWDAFGSPFKTGYSYWVPGLKEFSPSFLTDGTRAEGPYIYPDKSNGALTSFVCPCGTGGPMTVLRNYAFYPAVLLNLLWVFAPPLTSLIGLGRLWSERTTPAARYTAVLIVLNLGVLLFYWDTGARFLAPAASLLTVYSAVGVARVLEWAVGRVARRGEVRVLG